ncbi:MAG: hypothetical protein HC896_04410 [Bacteroidales bacterium]|nr:hypothetical protein [Bacteroidales bacterium]
MNIDRTWLNILLAFQFAVVGAQQKEYKQFLYPSGIVSSEGYLVNNKPDGYWKSYYPSGVLISEGKRTNYLLDSIWKFYGETGNLHKVVNYKNGVKNGYYIVYDLDASSHLENNMVSKELYLNDKKNGTAEYYKDGSIAERANYKDGNRHGYTYKYDLKG